VPLRKNKPVNPKTFILIAGDLAAEQRTVVAHSASYGFDHPQIFQAPAGATENHDSTLRSFDLWHTRSPIC